MKRTICLIVALALLLPMGLLIPKLLSEPKPSRDSLSEFATPASRAAHQERLEVDNTYASADPKLAIDAYSNFIAEHTASPDPQVQDEVGNAKLRIGYVLAKSHDYARAREVLLDAEKGYKGSGESSPDFGGLKDQAAYQAAVCLMAGGKHADATQAFFDFLKNYELSPLVHAARRRLIDLNGGKTSPKIDALLEKAVEEQQKRAAFEMSTCGPKAIQRLLRLLGIESKPYAAIARICKTTTQGTTLLGMQHGLRSLGIRAYGYELNQSDFESMPLPAIWLTGNHYLVVERFENGMAVVYDPLVQRDRPVKYAEKDGSNFSATVLTTTKMALGDTE